MTAGLHGPVPGAPVAVDLWLWPLTGTDAAADRRILAPDERARADRFVKAADGLRFMAARAGLRRTLGRYAGIHPEDVHLTTGRHGKPALGGKMPVPLAFNLSHAAGLAALAVCRDASLLLGIDIEGERPVEPGIDARAFAPEERVALAALSPDARAAAFFRGWTRKEAFVKATGEGLYASLGSFAVTLDTPARILRIDGESADRRNPVPNSDPRAWRLHDFSPRPGLAGAIAAMTGGREIVVIRRD